MALIGSVVDQALDLEKIMQNTARFALAALAMAATLPAYAQFNVNIGSADSAATYGDASNTTFNQVYNGANTVFTNVNVSGTAQEVIAGTYLSEMLIAVDNFVSGNFMDLQPGFGTSTYTGPLDVNRDIGVLFFATNGTSYDFQTWEGFDDGAGTDSTWSNLALEFTSSLMNLGSVGLGTNLEFDTVGSGYDTEIAVYDANGNLIDTNDDIGGGVLQSSVDVSGLGVGTYYVTIGGFNSAFADEMAVGGAEFGDFILNWNGQQVGSGATNEFELKTYEFEVVPEPATMTLLGVGALALMRRKKKA